MDELQNPIQSAGQARKFLDDKKNNGEFLEDKIVPRDIEQDVQEFIERSDKTGCILIGQPGMGKTHIVCHQVSHYLEAGYPVLAYGRGREVGAEMGDLASDISRMIVRDLGLDSEIPLIDHLARLDSALAAQKKLLLIFLDGVERPFSLDPNIGPQHLLRALDMLVQAWAQKNLRVKLLITCVTTVWDLYPTQDLISWPLYFTTKVPDKPLIVDRLNRTEFREAYRSYLGISPDQDRDQFERVGRTCEGDPFVLKLISEPELRAEALEGELSTAMVFDKYYEQRILGRGLGPEKERFLALFVKWLLKEGREDIPKAQAIRLQDRAYQALEEEGILVVNHPQETVQLHHTRLTEYLMRQHLEREYPSGSMGQETLYGLIQKAAPGFHALWGGLAGYLARWGTMDLFMQMARSDDYDHLQMVLGALEMAGQTGVRPEQEIQDVLGTLLRDEARQSRTVAIRAAVRLRQMDSVLEEVLNWITEAPTVAAEHVYLSWREMKETRLGDRMWDDLEKAMEEAWQRFSTLRLGPRWRIVSSAVVWLAQQAETLRKRLRVWVKRLEQLDAVFDFTLSFSGRILVNECYDETTIKRMSDIWDGTRKRAQEDVWLRVLLEGAQKAVPEAIKQRVDSFAEVVSPYLPSEGRILAKLLDPTVDLSTVEQAEDTILDLLGAKELVPAALASLALSVQTHRDLGRMEPVLRRLFKRSEPPQKLAILAGFGLHGERNVSGNLVQVLQDLTKELLTTGPEYLTTPRNPWGESQRDGLSLALAPLGLTWCNYHERLRQEKAAAIEPIMKLIKELGWCDNETRLQGMVESLVPVGIYFPEAVLHTLLKMGVFDLPGLEASLKRTLGVIQFFNSEQVYRFLQDQGLRVRPDRLAWESFDRLVGLFYWLSGVSFIYYSLHKENLRALWMGVVLALSGGEPPSEVQKRFSEALLRLAQEKDFQLQRILEEPVSDPQAIIHQIAGPGYAS